MFQIVLVPGATPQEFTRARAVRYKAAVVSEIDDDGTVIRVVAQTEWMEWEHTAPKPAGKTLEKPTLKKAVAPKKAAPKKKAVSKKKPAPVPETENKQSAIPDENSLENVDVSSI